jgi:hypothetical protein
MTQDQENKLKLLVQKYNDILLVSMKLAVAEDLINLIILNGDDKVQVYASAATVDVVASILEDVT